MMRRFNAHTDALFVARHITFGARDSVCQRAILASVARHALSHVPTSQALRLVCVRVGACDVRVWGACRAHPRASAQLFSWDIGTVGRKGDSR